MFWTASHINNLYHFQSNYTWKAKLLTFLIKKCYDLFCCFILQFISQNFQQWYKKDNKKLKWLIYPVDIQHVWAGKIRLRAHQIFNLHGVCSPRYSYFLFEIISLECYRNRNRCCIHGDKNYMTAWIKNIALCFSDTRYCDIYNMWTFHAVRKTNNNNNLYYLF